MRTSNHINISPPSVRKDNLFVGSVGKCFDILEILNEARVPLTLTEIVKISGMNKSTVQRFTHTLKMLGYIAQHPLTRSYILSSKMLRFGETILSTDPVREIAQPHLGKLNQACKETVNLVKLEGRDIIYVSRFSGLHPVSVNLHIGSRLPAFCTAGGRAILAFMPEEEALEILHSDKRTAMTAHTTTDIAALLLILRKVRTTGYALNDQEAFIGDISIAAPIFNSARVPVGAINIAVPYPRWTVTQSERKLAPLSLEYSRRISNELVSFI
jgi:IclR family pca regulon transcriptional regulator